MMAIKKTIFILLALVLLTSCAVPEHTNTGTFPNEEKTEKDLIEKTNEAIKMKKALFIIAQTNFRDEEYTIPKEILEKNNIEVVSASVTTGTAQAR